PTPFCISLCALAPTQYFPLSLHDALPISLMAEVQYAGAFAFHEFGERDLNARQVIADPAHPGFFYWGARPLYHIPGVFDTCAGGSDCLAASQFTNIRRKAHSRPAHSHGLVARFH